MNKQAPYAQWREELNAIIAEERKTYPAFGPGKFLEALQVRLLLEQVEALDRIALALDALVATRYGG